MVDLVQSLWPYLTGALHVLAAALVTVHVVLTKGEVRAAIGWVGLAWLAPIIGSLIYIFFGINRVTRRAGKLDWQSRNLLAARSGHVVGRERAKAAARAGYPLALGILGTSLTQRPVLMGNSIKRLAIGDEAYPQMLQAIGGAQVSIALSSYIFRNDEAGRDFIEALDAAQKRGAQVRVLLDGIGAGYWYSSTVRALGRRGIPAARFMHTFVPWRMPYINMRNHRKILVVDGRTGFTGGTNIGAENMIASNPRHPVKDLHFRVEGPVVSHLMAAFAEDWVFTAGEELEGETWFPTVKDVGPVMARGISGGPDEDLEKLGWTIAGALGEARKRVQVVTPYFLPEQSLIGALALAAMRGVQVDIVLPDRSNHFFMDWAAYAQHEQVLGPGCRIFLTPPPFDHSKLMTIDGVWLLFGSTNWDPRSLRLNFEFNVECYDKGLARETAKHIDRKIATARNLTIDDIRARSGPVKVRDGLARLALPYL